MSIAPVGDDSVAVYARKAQEASPAPRIEEDRNPLSVGDTVEISAEGKAKAEKMRAEKQAEHTPDRKQSEAQMEEKPATDRSASFSMNKNSGNAAPEVDKEETVDELQDTESDLRKKEDELQEVKTAFFGPEEDQARKIKELERDIDDLTDTKDELESKLSQ